jgi:hypothetical protein
MTITRNGFQSFVNTYQPLGQKGARASMNPFASVLGGEGDFRADATDVVTVGNFAWFVPGGTAHGVQTAGGIIGFVSNELEGLITDWLAQERMTLPSGVIVPGYTHGDFWAELNGTGAAAVGDTVYAVNASGAPSTSSSSATDTGFKVASAIPAQASSSGNVTIDGTTGVMTVAVTVTGAIQTAVNGQVGANVNGTGVPANVFVLNQLTGTAGSNGTYNTTYRGANIAAFTNSTFTTSRLAKISRTY